MWITCINTFVVWIPVLKMVITLTLPAGRLVYKHPHLTIKCSNTCISIWWQIQVTECPINFVIKIQFWCLQNHLKIWMSFSIKWSKSGLK